MVIWTAITIRMANGHNQARQAMNNVNPTRRILRRNSVAFAQAHIADMRAAWTANHRGQFIGEALG